MRINFGEVKIKIYKFPLNKYLRKCRLQDRSHFHLWPMEHHMRQVILVNIGSGNGLAFVGCRSISWTSVDLLSIELKNEQTSVDFELRRTFFCCWKIAFENVFCKIATILYQPQFVTCATTPMQLRCNERRYTGMTSFLEISKPRDIGSDLSETLRQLRQWCCRSACQISERYNNFNTHYRGFKLR